MDLEPISVSNTFVACRLPVDFRARIQAYAEAEDLSISQVIRKGLKLVLENQPKHQWLVGR